MGAADLELAAMIDRVRALGDVEQLAKVAAPLVEAAVKGTAAAGTSPDGTPWAPRKDGSPALANAAAAVRAEPIGTKVRISLVSTSTGSALAQAVQDAQRPILPRKGKLGKPVTDALTTAAKRYFERSMGR